MLFLLPCNTWTSLCVPHVYVILCIGTNEIKKILYLIECICIKFLLVLYVVYVLMCYACMWWGSLYRSHHNCWTPAKVVLTFLLQENSACSTLPDYLNGQTSRWPYTHLAKTAKIIELIIPCRLNMLHSTNVKAKY